MHATLESVVLSLALVMGFGAPRASAQTGSQFTQPRLEQMAAPIALYPDALLAQILTSSTYPFEIFEAQRWAQRNSGLAGDALERALTQQDWEPSVKAMCGFPSVLAQMYDNLDWTKDLGDALLGQRTELLATVQRLRQWAVESGKLKTSEQQTVSHDSTAIVVTSANPDVVHVPSYSALVVYGAAWSYPTNYYPTLNRAPAAGQGAVAFTTGVAWGAAMFANCDWRRGEVNVDVASYDRFDKRTAHNAADSNANKGNVENSTIQNTVASQMTWRHDPAHRQGVSYANAETARQYGAAQAANRYPQERARGYGDTTAARATAGAEGAFSGSRNSVFDRYASERGAASRGGGAVRRSKGATE